MTGFGVHEDHAVHPHSHDGQDLEHRRAEDWCSGHWFCATCTEPDADPRGKRGVWFSGPVCPKPAARAKAVSQ